MKLDLSPFIHAAIAAAIQSAFGFVFDQWAIGGVVGCVWFVAREHTQAEYRWIATYGRGKRSNMPWYGGFDYRVWNLASVLDFAVPVFICASLAMLHNL